MIDLNHTREQMLAEIKASANVFAHGPSDPTDPSFVSLDEARLLVHGKTREELLPALNAALSARFANAPPEQLFDDLLYLLKRGLAMRINGAIKKIRPSGLPSRPW